MNGLYFSTDGAFQTMRVEVAMCRWGGGADPGKTHVFLFGCGDRRPRTWVGVQCVVDDFGDLVVVPS